MVKGLCVTRPNVIILFWSRSINKCHFDHVCFVHTSARYYSQPSIMSQRISQHISFVQTLCGWKRKLSVCACACVCARIYICTVIWSTGQQQKTHTGGINMKLSSAVKGKDLLWYQTVCFSLHYIQWWTFCVSLTVLGSLCLLLIDGFPGTE